jgi:hypothetical protein
MTSHSKKWVYGKYSIAACPYAVYVLTYYCAGVRTTPEQSVTHTRASPHYWHPIEELITLATDWRAQGHELSKIFTTATLINSLSLNADASRCCLSAGKCSVGHAEERL